MILEVKAQPKDNDSCLWITDISMLTQTLKLSLLKKKKK